MMIAFVVVLCSMIEQCFPYIPHSFWIFGVG